MRQTEMPFADWATYTDGSRYCPECRVWERPLIKRHRDGCSLADTLPIRQDLAHATA